VRRKVARRRRGLRLRDGPVLRAEQVRGVAVRGKESPGFAGIAALLAAAATALASEKPNGRP
jgi:hypothetical protein